MLEELVEIAGYLMVYSVIAGVLFACISELAKFLTGTEVKRAYLDLSNNIFISTFLLGLAIILISLIIEAVSRA